MLGVAIRRGDIKGDDAWLLDDRYCALFGIRDTWVRHGLALACRAVLEIARCAKEMIPSGRKGPFKILLVTENVGPLEAIVRLSDACCDLQLTDTPSVVIPLVHRVRAFVKAMEGSHAHLTALLSIALGAQMDSGSKC